MVQLPSHSRPRVQQQVVVHVREPQTSGRGEEPLLPLRPRRPVRADDQGRREDHGGHRDPAGDHHSSGVQGNEKF